MRQTLMIAAAVVALAGYAHESRSQPETRDPARGVNMKMWDLCLSAQLYQQLKDRKGDAEEMFSACREEEMAALPEDMPEEERQQIRRSWLARQLRGLRDRE